ncbi:MAG: trypsin-like peptidase domain-containing protein [Lachnospiraceae bacterium]|nr:trypsin-like peptidase domain-containing protein [Lachnospiraceae bacterium]
MYEDNDSRYNDYRFNNGMNNMNSHIPDVPGNNGNKKPEFWKKALAAIALGLLFGAFAGAGLYVAGLLTGSGNNSAAQTEAPAAAADNNEGVNASEAPKPAVSANTAIDRGMVPAVTTTTGSVTATGALDVSDVAENVMPAVVSITNNYVQTAQDIFGQQYRSQSEAAGSGIIVGDNGDELLIATNQHVVDDAESLKVQFIDGSEADANVKGEDESADLAVIAVNKSDLSGETSGQIKVASLGDSDSLKVGQTAIAIGNSLGYGQSVTTGVISAVNRELTLSNGTHKMIQTDAAINPGNSGGALLDINGNVIGINEAKLSSSAIEGMGYAIPISDAREIIDSLMNQSTKIKASDDERGFLGISGVDVTAQISEQYNMPRGVYISKVGSGLAADNAGIKEKSIITSFDGQSIQTMEQLQSLMQYYRIGDVVKITIQEPLENDYGYNEKTIEVTLGGQTSMTGNGTESTPENESGNPDNAPSGPQDGDSPDDPDSYYYGTLEDFFNSIW